MAEALRYNTGKPQLSYVLSCPRALGALARVFEQGAIKYERDNWRLGGKPDQEYVDSAGRHLTSLASGEPYDPDTGCLHAAHVMWNMLALIELNYAAEELPDLDPDFDQQAFVDKYSIKPAVIAAEVKDPEYYRQRRQAADWASGVSRTGHNPIDL